MQSIIKTTESEDFGLGAGISVMAVKPQRVKNTASLGSSKGGSSKVNTGFVRHLRFLQTLSFHRYTLEDIRRDECSAARV